MPRTYRTLLILTALAILQSCKTPKPIHKKPPPGTDFVELAALAFPPDGGVKMEYSDVLWGELYQLPRWYFLMTPASQATKMPSVQTIAGKAWYLVFTDPAKLKYYAKKNQNLDAKGNALYVTMTPAQAVEFARVQSNGPVFGVRFNEGQKAGWFAPMRNLTLFPEYLKAKGLH